MANFVERDSVLVRIRKYLFPCKGDNTGEVIRKIVFLAGIIVLIGAISFLLVFKLKMSEDTEINKELSELFHGETTVDITEEEITELKEEYPDVLESFLPLLERNPYTVGWIKIPGMIIDYPVLQAANNDYFLNHNFDMQESVSGSLFADYHFKLTPEEQPANIVIYGHNMESGEYFGTLPYYYSSSGNISWYLDHPIIEFSTLYEEATYKIFGGVLTNTKEEAGEVFRYHTVRNFANKSEFDEFCANILDRSVFINPDVDLRYGDELITLSTCAFGSYGGDTADPRFVIFARKTREGEDESVDVSNAYANPDPLYYDLYYEIHGGSWGGRTWDENIIQGYSY